MSTYLTPIKAIRRHCLSCSGDSPKEVRLCVITDCPLYPYRLGKNPHRKGKTLTPEEKLVLKDRLLKARSIKKNSK